MAMIERAQPLSDGRRLRLGVLRLIATFSGLRRVSV